MEITPEVIEREIYPMCTAATIRNYITGKTRPKQAKFKLVLNCIKTQFPNEYSVAKSRVLTKMNVNDFEEYIFREIKKTNIGGMF